MFSDQNGNYKIASLKFLVLFIAFTSISYSPVQAGRVDVHVMPGYNVQIGKNASNAWMPGIGVGYDFRNPTSRCGWSIVPSVSVTTAPLELKKTDLIFRAMLAGKYRYNFNQQWSVDMNVGGSLGMGIYIPDILFLLSTSFNYSFENGIMAGISLTDFIPVTSVSQFISFSVDLSFPIANDTDSDK